MNIKLLVCDLDDTMIGESKKASDRLKEALEKARKSGVKTAIATGRMYSSALPFVKKLGFDGVLISFNGAHVINTVTNEHLSYYPHKKEAALEVLEFAKEFGVYAQYYALEKYFFVEHCEYSKFYNRLTGLKGIATSKDLTKTLDFDPVKVLLMCNTENKERVYQAAKERFSHKMEVICSSEFMVEFNSLGITKGKAVEEVAKHYGIHMDNVMTIGNGDNDISMIKSAGLGVAVENATEDLKKAADFITLSQEEDGVAFAIEKFILS